MIHLAQASPNDNLHVADLVYRLNSWALDDPGNVGWWVNGEGQLLAWAVMQTPFWTIDYAFDADVDAEVDLHRRILAWADDRACQVLNTRSGRRCWFVMLFPDQVDRIRDLEQAGFLPQADVGDDSWSRVVMGRTASVPVSPYTLPEGFTIRPLAGENEVAAYVRLHRAVFGSENLTAAWRARTLRHPEYDPDLDLVAVAPDGRLVAFCVCWISGLPDAETVGQIEPLGVDPAFRRLGIGRAILSEGSRQLHRRGAASVIVETDKGRSAAVALYEAVGFHPLRDVLVYRKDYADEQR
jgi:ribosomal protein S18 acetylase RimI-like enzyme